MSEANDTVRGEPTDRLDSWKRIAAYLKRDVSTVQRWERREGMPVHRHLHDKLGSVFAFRSELDEWWQSRRDGVEAADARGGDETTPGVEAAPPPDAPSGEPQPSEPPRVARRLVPWILLAAIVAAVAGGAWLAVQRDIFWRNPLADARFIPSAAFAEIAQSAAISRDGRYVAVLAERDGRADAWVSEFGSDSYRDVTGGALRDLVNPSVRTLGFSFDSSLVSIWTRLPDGSRPDDVSVWAAPTQGGALEPYLRNVAELDWSPDGERMAYHTTAPGDPLFVRETRAGTEGVEREIYVAPAGVHDHFPTWSPDGAFIYFVRGVPPDHWDVWRIRPSGSGLERVTAHDTRVAYPVMLDARTLMYLATDADGSGPWIYGMDVERRIPHRLSAGLETYTSLGASRNGARLVATVARRRTSLWRMPLRADAAAESAAEPTLLLADGTNPRVGRGLMLFTASRGARQGVWSLVDGSAKELWSRANSRLVGAPAISPDSRRIAFTTDDGGKTRLYVMDSDGSNGRALTDTLALRGNPAWWPDGESIVSAVVRDGVPQLMRIFLNGDAPVVLVSEYAIDPVWSPGNQFVVYSGADVGTTFPLRAAEADGRPHPIPGLMLTRGARRVAFLGDGRTLIFLRGELAHKDLWLLDLQSGEQRALTQLPQDFTVGDFDVSADGTEIILDRIEEDSTLALIERRQ
ncbi:MAG TPA: DNA-binding protein [Gammaproteobacteria bacterium]